MTERDRVARAAADALHDWEQSPGDAGPEASNMHDALAEALRWIRASGQAR